jgi:GntR family transcriptional regulator
MYEQVKRQIKAQIFEGSLNDGDLLPSIRQLAKDLKISVITITRAYNDLEAEGFIATLQGKGSYVLPRDKELAHEHALTQVEQGLQVAIDAAKTGNVTKAEILETLELLLQEENLS